MMDQNLSTLTLTAINAVLQAGEILKRGFGTNYEIFAKPGRQNFVTEFDRRAEESIITLIKNQFPQHGILAEESGYNNPSEDSILWIIDPLDGTTNFARNLPSFTISIAAYRKEEGLCGVIYQPMTNELFIAEKGKGAYLNGNRIQTSSVKHLRDSLVIAALPYENKIEPEDALILLYELNHTGATIRNFGSAALSLAYVAAGKADALWVHKLYPWDIAAGKILIEEAGGIVSLYNAENNFLEPSEVIASNHEIYPAFSNFLNH